MTTSKLIEMLQESLLINGDLKIEGICDGDFIEFIDINVPGEDAPLYLEFLNKYR